MKVIIDRFEGRYAVIELEIGEMINVPRELFPNAKEGDVFNIVFDNNETESRKKKITNLMNDLFVD